MKARFNARLAIAAASAAAIAITGAVVAPAQAATRSTVVVHETNALTSFNSSTPDTNLTTNTDVLYLTGAGFNYYDDKKTLVKNTIFGSYKIVKNTATDFRVAYTINKGLVWSDGAAITGVDLLLSHILNSSEYSKTAGLGDPAAASGTPAFNSLGYDGTYDNAIVGLPELSADKMTVTLHYKNPIPNWDLYGPGPSSVHALVLLADGKKALPSAAEAQAATDAFLKAFQSKDTATLKKIGKVWSEAFNITSVDASTNPLLLVSNGGFIISSAVTNQSVTMKVNPKYNSGPKLSGGVDTVIFKFIADGTAASQALANGEIDLYSGQATADAVSQLKAMKGVSLANGTSACYEHIDLRTGESTSNKTSDPYKGVFSDASPKGKDLRKAFLLAYPREEIVAKIVVPVNSAAVVPLSTFVLPGQSNYSKVTSGNGSTVYSAGTQEARTAQALRLVKKWYPTASATNAIVPVVLEVPSPNTRRAAEAALVVPALAKAGFKVDAQPTTGWSGKLNSSTYDAEFFAWCPSAVLQSGTNANFQSTGANNHMGWNYPALDTVLHSLEKVMPDNSVDAKIIQSERIINDNALTAAIFQHPAVTAYNSALKNVKPAPLIPNLVWNYWEWTY